MNVKTRLAVSVGRFTQWFLKTFTNGGSSLPGKIATKISPNLLKELGQDYEVVVITGTNGKTVTTSLTVNILKQKFDHVMTNDTGSNMLQGVVSSFLEDTKNKNTDRKIAVLEVDEASLRHVTEYIKPKAILVTNIFPDQVDRYGNIELVYNYILEGVLKSPDSLLLLNGDVPILNSKETKNQQQFYGFTTTNIETNRIEESKDDTCPVCGSKIDYHSETYSNLGDYFCPNCGLKRPKLTNVVDEVIEMTTESATFSMDGKTYTIPMSGLYNVYNALAAYSIGQYFNVSEEDVSKGLNSASRMFGRQEIIKIDDKDVRINLVKNTVGLNETINLVDLEEDEFSLIMILNDNAADGKDISWIEQGNFEKLTKMGSKETFVSGTRKNDLINRMVKAGFSRDNLLPLEDAKEIIEAIKKMKTKKVYILTTYTSMLALREEMYDQGLVKDKLKA